MRTKCPFRPRTVVFWTAASLLLLAGCPDPEATYQEFLDNTAHMRGGSGPILGDGIKDIGDGTFLLTIRASMATGNPLLFRVATSALRTTEDGGATVDLTIDPLVAQYAAASCGPSRSPAPAHPADSDGEATILVHDVAIDPEDGTFAIDFGDQLVHGCANAISGADIKARLILEGATLSENRFCGAMDGRLIEPYDAPLPGEFAFVRIDGEVPSEEELPADSTCVPEEEEGEPVEEG